MCPAASRPVSPSIPSPFISALFLYPMTTHSKAPRAWFHKLREALHTWGFISSTLDTSLFIYKHNDNFLLLLVYVDDLLITGNNAPLIQTLIQDLHNRFALKDLGLVKDFLGFEALRITTGLHLTQSKYMIDLLTRTKMHSSKPVPTPMSAALKLHAASGPAFSDPTLYRSTIGALQYLTYTRPGIAFVGTVHHGLHFTPASSLHLQVYTEADWASSIDDRHFTTGYCVFLGANLLTWSSRKQSVVARSSTEAEYRALSHASTEVAWLCSLFSELGISLVNTLVIWCDNQGVGALAANPVFHSRTKHIEVDVHYVREQVLDQKLVVSYVPSVEQVVDLFTKPLSIPRFHYLLTKLNLAVSLGCA
ncbi:Retrovirus-related Pol polyprotein from transposon RE1 [Vitis vinifera]|uniref:Retrovirus-related Pol polyprotein from transposon RE1 n=1 Tax=Vitis vinifera TaxID=29760 RepID=A0A438EXP6_VITVI|nr:Retrovirus-related Pol polyprotein from transposon RE1 [Vitis vinifera]RVX17119.1 Retrovirus-related Pol polyprotein from transposon RE1 [Vitis vinifera]